MEIERLWDAPDAETTAGLRDLYVSAFSQPPYLEGPSEGEDFVARLRRYAAERDGFALDVIGPLSRPRGLALSVLAHPGDWWRGQVEAELSPEQASLWLGSSCRELVHVAIRPNHQHEGLGRALTTHVVSHAQAPTVVLACHPEALAAQRLYLSCGFEVLTESFRTAPEHVGYWIMARESDQDFPVVT